MDPTPGGEKGGIGVVKRIFSVAIVLAAAAACTKEPPPATTSNTGFGSEQTTPRSSGTGGDSSMFRTIYFDFDSSALTADARTGLKANADYLKSNSAVAVVIEGNTDERGSAEYNLALGKRRAEAAYKYLVDSGIPAARLSTVSFGEEKPAVEGHNELAWSKNRRDDFKAR
jgi:peptidoglycan-associated lipoprotein